jgi:ribosomal protein S18 acetylase RimI-like enzyme
VQELWDAYRASSETSGYNFVVSRDDTGRVIGYACYGPHALTAGTHDLYWIAVDPQSRGRGVAHELLARVEDEVRARGGRLLVVETSSTPAYIPARHFYQSCGYRLEAEVHDFYGPGDDLVIYTKVLTDGGQAASR